MSKIGIYMYKYTDPFERLIKIVVGQVWAIKTCEEGAGCFTHSLWVDEASAEFAMEEMNLNSGRNEYFVTVEEVYGKDL